MPTLSELNQSSLDGFVDHLGTIYERSPWIAAAAWEHRPFASEEDLSDAMRSIVEASETPAKLALLRAHPDLAGKLAMEDRLTAESKHEQASLGLDRLSESDFATLSDLNARYRETFAIPFIVCVRQVRDLPELLEIFRHRLGNPQETEHRTALAQVHEIARLRLADLLA